MLIDGGSDRSMKRLSRNWEFPRNSVDVVLLYTTLTAALVAFQICAELP